MDKETLLEKQEALEQRMRDNFIKWHEQSIVRGEKIMRAIIDNYQERT